MSAKRAIYREEETQSRIVRGNERERESMREKIRCRNK